jgi:hypothetical protein
MSFRLFFSSFVRHTCLLFDLRIVGKEDMVPRGQALIGLSEVLTMVRFQGCGPKIVPKVGP